MAESKTYTEEELQAAVEEKLAAAKAEGDKAFATLWEEAKAAKSKAREIEAADKELRDKVAQLEQAEKAKKAGVTSEELARLRSEVRGDLEKDYSDFKARAEVLARENRALKLDNVVKGVMAKAGVRAERVDALFRLAGDQFDLTDDGQPMLRERPGTPVEKFVAEDLSKLYPEFFQGTGSSGGGAPKSAGGASGHTRSIAANDMQAFLANVDGIAKGDVKVLRTP